MYLNHFFPFLLPIASLLITLTASSQIENDIPMVPASVRAYDSLLFSRIPLVEPGSVRTLKSLPVSVDNSIHPWFAGFTLQSPYWACLQVSSCTYMFGYEINRARGLNGKLPENTYPFLYTWTFFNHGINTGVSSFHSFHLLQNQGAMNRTDMGPDSLTAYTGWPTGYNKYYDAMKNRIRKVRGIRVDTEEGINLVKNYLNDHFTGSSSGGLVHFATSCSEYEVLPAGTPEAGHHVVTALSSNSSHGFTTVGYNDSIRIDLNNDGMYTNNLDINEDGIVDIRDWEIGGFKQIESYNAYYADDGYFYLLYSAIARD
ncbi:MAG: hypothetical protein JXA23_00595, partial [Bacteroidales bacterium]|nr:hypothetical protein [Bacteroidales bacterium]